MYLERLALLSIFALTSCSSDSGPLFLKDIHLKRFDSCDEIEKARNISLPTHSRGEILTQTPSNDATFGSAESGVLGETNIQTAGVDEIDHSKAEGDFIYRMFDDTTGTVLASSIDGYPTGFAKLEVLRRTPHAQAGKVMTVELGDHVAGLFLLPNELIALSQNNRTRKIYIHYFDRFSNGHIEMTNKLEVDGWLNTARLVGHRLHLVTKLALPDEIQPDVVTSTVNEGERLTTHKCSDVLHEPAAMKRRYIMPYVNTLACVFTLDTQKKFEKPHGECVAGNNDATVYASRENLFLASRGWLDKTPIHQFALAPVHHETKYVGSGIVDGRLLNSFAMDEHDKFLRVATSIDTDSTNEVALLEITGSDLAIAAKLKNIGRGEEIYSVRFMGDIGYLVTFRRFDPFYTLDFSNPLNPVIRGELKIPGFSTYLHPMQNGYVLAIGKETEDISDNENGGFPWIKGVALSIFDVRDLDDPKLVHKTTIGGTGTNSEALHDHKAFRYLEDEGIVVFPISLYSESPNQNQHGEYEYSGFQIHSVSVENGFDLVGESIFPQSDENYWWGTYKSSRSFFREGILSLVGGGQFVLRHQTDWDTDLVDIEL